MIKPFQIIGPEPREIRCSEVLQKFESFINRFTYKPNTILCWGALGGYRSRVHTVFVDLIMEAVDANGGSKIVPITHRSTINSEWVMANSFEAIRIFIFTAIRDAEMHELEEFFKVDGERVYDPHKNDKNT